MWELVRIRDERAYYGRSTCILAWWRSREVMYVCIPTARLETRERGKTVRQQLLIVMKQLARRPICTETYAAWLSVSDGKKLIDPNQVPRLGTLPTLLHGQPREPRSEIVPTGA